MKGKCKNRQQELNLLVSRMTEGDLAAFSAIYRMYYNKLFRYGNIILPEAGTVEDVIQDLFVWILKNPQKLKRVIDFEIYLFQSLKNNLIAFKRKNNYSKTLLYQFSNTDSPHSYEKGIEHKLIETENQEFNKNWVKKKLDELPTHQKEIIYLRYYQGLSYEEIAAVHSTSKQVIRNYVSRAVKRIRRLSEMEKLSFILWLSLVAFCS